VVGEVRGDGLHAPSGNRQLRRAVGFRNIAVHEYQTLNLEILQQVVEQSRKDLTEFCAALGLKIV
jgi:uncharacterized protein YutE (UPF0331/DUF86 family)